MAITETKTRALPGFRGRFAQVIDAERSFVIGLLLVFSICALTYQTPWIAMWVGFAIAAYSAVANDSIQTIGTLIASNRDQKWWILWLFIGGIFVATVTYSFVVYDGDVTYHRLAARGFATAPASFTVLQVAAPLCLLILTRLKMPVSTTFLLLSCFATEASGVGDVLLKSVAGYFVAFIGALLIWLLLSKTFDRWFVGEPHRLWRPAQWLTSGFLWSVWIMQDAANIAVYLPRQMGIGHFVVFTLVVFLALGLLFKMGGERVQAVVTEKSKVVDVRSATMIDLVYGGILYYFKVVSNVPMSTTWVFVGLLAGRELAMALRRSSGVGPKRALQLMGKDLFAVTVGLIVSMGLAYAVNDSFRIQIDALFS